MDNHQKIINRIFKVQDENGFWKLIPESNKYYPNCLHYVPNYKSTLWTLILLADLGCDKNDKRIKPALPEIRNHFFDPDFGIYSLKEDHFPIPCLNGNMIYLDCYFNGFPCDKSLKALEFFAKFQRFDDGAYIEEKNEYCSNKSCYGKHTCYWGIVKLLKGISFIPVQYRTSEINNLVEKCIQFILLHKVCFSSRKENKIMMQGINKLTFPNMYKSDFLEILWLLKREHIKSDLLLPAINLLKSKQQEDNSWFLERKIHNMITSIGQVNQTNPYITQRAQEVVEFYDN